jgi:hypothetical protein
MGEFFCLHVMCRENAGFLAVSKETDNTNKQQRRRKLVL